MFKTIENKWNAHTPVYLHNGTKENLTFQISLAAGVIGVYVVRDMWTDRKLKRLNTPFRHN